jgi:acyl dehydratase
VADQDASPAEGDELGPVSLELTFQRMIMIASANRDFAPIHIDRDYARSSGADDAYTNMMFVMAMMERTIEEWIPSARLRAFKGLRMVAFNRVDDVVACRGRVTRVDPDHERVEVDIWLETGPERRTAEALAVVDLAGLQS